MSWKRDVTEMLSGWVEVKTARAMLFHSDFMEEPIWLPLSQITRIDEISGNINRYEIDVKAWLLQKNKYQ